VGARLSHILTASTPSAAATTGDRDIEGALWKTVEGYHLNLQYRLVASTSWAPGPVSIVARQPR